MVALHFFCFIMVSTWAPFHCNHSTLSPQSLFAVYILHISLIQMFVSVISNTFLSIALWFTINLFNMDFVTSNNLAKGSWCSFFWNCFLSVLNGRDCNLYCYQWILKEHIPINVLIMTYWESRAWVIYLRLRKRQMNSVTLWSFASNSESIIGVMWR